MACKFDITWRLIIIIFIVSLYIKSNYWYLIPTSRVVIDAQCVRPVLIDEILFPTRNACKLQVRSQWTNHYKIVHKNETDTPYYVQMILWIRIIIVGKDILGYFSWTQVHDININPSLFFFANAFLFVQTRPFCINCRDVRCDRR